METIIDFQEKIGEGLTFGCNLLPLHPCLDSGTVTGMIDVFRQITNFANPENSEFKLEVFPEALVTTKFGLVTAIPALVIHALLNRRLQGIVSRMEGFSARLVHLKKENPNRFQPRKER